MKDMIIEDSLRYFNRNSSITIDHFIDYDSFFNQLISIHDSSAKAMAYALFEKYEINKCQVDLFRRKNEPNPVFIHELKTSRPCSLMDNNITIVFIPSFGLLSLGRLARRPKVLRRLARRR